MSIGLRASAESLSATSAEPTLKRAMSRDGNTGKGQRLTLQWRHTERLERTWIDCLRCGIMSELVQCCSLSLLDIGYGATVFIHSVATADKLKCSDQFEQWAKQSGYKSWPDWLLCRLWPEYEGECRAYYAGKGKRFADLHRRHVRHTDSLMARCIVESMNLVKERG